MTFLITGAAGFIGYHLSNLLLARGERVVGFDNLNSYYDVRLKEARLGAFARVSHFHVCEGRPRGRGGGRARCLTEYSDPRSW